MLVCWLQLLEGCSTVQYDLIPNQSVQKKIRYIRFKNCVFIFQYKTHYIKGKDGSPLPFVFNDIMGLQAEDSSGAQVQDIITAIKGSLVEGYKVRKCFYIHKINYY